MSYDLKLPKLEELSQCKEIESFCIELVFEFLVCNNFKKTIRALTEEIEGTPFKLPKLLPAKKERIEKDDVFKILSAMEMEDHLQFFERWSTLVPPAIKDVPDYRNITLPLYTYFATLPVRREKNTQREDNFIKDNAEAEANTKINVTNEVEGSSGELSKLKIESLSSTFTLKNPTITVVSEEVDNTSEREPDYDPDSLESEMETSDTERLKMCKHIIKKAVEDEEDTVVIYDADGDKNKIQSSKDVIDTNENVEIHSEIERKTVTDESTEEDATEEIPSAMSMFQEFLLRKKYSFNTEPQYLPLFALPFIQNPEEHEAFNQLFQDKWVKDLKESLLNFLIKFSCGDEVVPEIVKLCKEHKHLSKLSKNNTADECLKLYKESRRKLHKLKRDHKNLVGVASELATALENSVRGEAVDIKSTIYKCITIFPELFPGAKVSGQSYANSEATETSYKERSWMGVSHLDTKKIKEDFTNGSIKNKLILMQALRWGICDAEVEERERIICWLGREDVLGLDGANGYGRDWLGSAEAHPLQQSIARMLNCIASLRSGRDYITEVSPPLVPVVVESLMRVSAQDRLTQDMLLALLQKLSLRKEMSEEMIKQGMLEWLSNRLSVNKSLYQLEYTTSLFMNLCIHAPVSYWDTRPHQVLPPLIKILHSTSAEQVLEFVLGSLYCLLRSDKLNIFARSVGLSGELTALGVDHCQRQTTELLKLHRRELPTVSLSLPPPTLNEEDIDDPEEMEAEVNADDPVKGTPSGNELLALQYALIFPTPSVVGRGGEGRMRLRPSTPRALQSLPAWAV